MSTPLGGLTPIVLNSFGWRSGNSTISRIVVSWFRGRRRGREGRRRGMRGEGEGEGERGRGGKELEGVRKVDERE